MVWWIYYLVHAVVDCLYILSQPPCRLNRNFRAKIDILDIEICMNWKWGLAIFMDCADMQQIGFAA